MQIPTAPSTVSKMRAEAKLRSRDGTVTHTQALEAISREHGYESWHHVTLCEARTRARNSMTTITLAGMKGGSGLTTLCEETWRRGQRVREKRCSCRCRRGRKSPAMGGP